MALKFCVLKSIWENHLSMSSPPSKEDRNRCYSARDLYWDCLDKLESGVTGLDCVKIREGFIDNCPSVWVKHFDRKREYLKFKAQQELEERKEFENS